MPERVDAIAVDVRDGAGRAHLEVAANERHANGVTLSKRARRSGRAWALASAADNHPDEPSLRERAGEQIDRFRLEAAHHDRRGNRAEEWSDLGPLGGRKPDRLDVGRAAGKRHE